jgi:glycosyltransferase involved in cell wall biosynthesis
LLSKTSSILRRATRKPGDRLNILTYPTHEAYASSWETLNADFYLLTIPGSKTWNPLYRPLPSNHTIIHDIPPDLELDCLLCQNLDAQYPLLSQLWKQCGIALVTAEHCLRSLHVSPSQSLAMKYCFPSNAKVFVSKASALSHQYSEDEYSLIYPGVDCNKFCPDPYTERGDHVLTVGNFIDTRVELGWPLLAAGIPEGVKLKVIGSGNPDIQRPATSLNHLVSEYRAAGVYFCSTTHSNCPLTLLESLATATPTICHRSGSIPEFMDNGYNGFVIDTAEEARQAISWMLSHREEARIMGMRGRETIIKMFSNELFCSRWQNLFNTVANLPCS